MGGQEGGRGYLLQTLICLLDSLDASVDWQTVTVEPENESEKVDIKWTGKATRVDQVKSSQNQISLPDVKKWCIDLEDSTQADEYTLRLLGPCSQGVADADKIGKVRIPAPESLEPSALIERAAQKLDKFLTRESNRITSPFLRELLVNAIANKLAMFSSSGTPVDRVEFTKLIDDWISESQQLTLTSNARKTIPKPLREFAGRSSELATLESKLGSGVNLVGFRGMPGVGKTSMARKFIANVRDSFKEHQIWIDLQGNSSQPVSSANAMRRILETISPGSKLPTDADAIAQLYVEQFGDSNSVLLLENASDPNVIGELALGPRGITVFTTRQVFALPSAEFSDVKPFPIATAVEYLEKCCPRLKPQSELVAELCGRLPLALSLCAGACAQRPDIPLEKFVDRLSGNSERLSFVDAAMQTSFDLFNESEKRCFSLLALFSLDFDVAAAGAVWEIAEKDADEVVGTFVRQSIVEWDGDCERYWLHDLVHLFAASKFDHEDSEQNKWAFCRHFANLCVRIEEMYLEGHDGVFESLKIFDDDRANFGTALTWLSQQIDESEEARELCMGIVLNTVRHRDIRQHPLERIAWHSKGIEAARRIPDGPSALACTGNIARALADMGNYEAAKAQNIHCLNAAQEFGLTGYECVGNVQVGNMCTQLGEYRESLPYFENGLRIAEQLGDRTLQAHALAGLGRSHGMLLQKEQALESLGRATSIFVELGDHLNLMKTMMANSELAFRLNQYGLVIEIVPKAIELAADIDDPLSIIKSKLLLGRAFLENGDPQLAVEQLEEVVDHAQSLGLAYLVFSSLRALAVAYQKAGQPQKANEVIQEHQAAALQIAEATDDIKHGEFVIADLCRLRGEFPAAIEFYEKELLAARENQDVNSELSIYRNLTVCYEESNDRSKFVESFRSLVSVAKTLNHPLLESLEKRLSEIDNEG